jgi:hypothetical protein
MYKTELELEKRLNAMSLASVPSTSYENVVVVPKFKHYASLDMSPAEFDLRDLALEQKSNIISMNAIVNKLGWKPSKIKSAVTKEMIADYQLEMMKNMKRGVYIPASVDMDLLEEPDRPVDVLINRDEIAARRDLNRMATRIAEIQAELAQVPIEVERAHAAIEKQLADNLLRADRLYPNPIQRANGKSIIRRQFDEEIAQFDNVTVPEHVSRLNDEAMAIRSEFDRISQTIRTSGQALSDYQRELSDTRNENARRRKIYEDQVRTLNSGVNFTGILPNETIDEYNQRLKDIGDSTTNGDAVESAASLLYTDRLREKMAEITRDDVLVGDFIKRLSTDERYSLVKIWETFKKKVLEIFGVNNRFMSSDDLVNIAEELADIVAVRAIAEPIEFKEVDERVGEPIRVFAVEEGTSPAVSAPERYVLSRNATALSSARRASLLALANEGIPLRRLGKLNRDTEAIFRAELALIEEFRRGRAGGGGEERSVPTLTSEPAIPPIDVLRAELQELQRTSPDQAFIEKVDRLLAITSSAELVREAKKELITFEFERRGRGLSGRSIHSKYPKIVPFGLIELSPHKLFYENVLKITRRGKHLTGFPNVKVSNEMVSFIFKILDGQQPTLRDVNQLSTGEKQLFDSIVLTAGLQKKVESTGSGLKQSLKDRLALIEGEVEAGNTSPLLIKEARKILQHLARMKIIGHRAAAGHLKQLINAQRG